MAAINHPNFVTVYAVEQIGDEVFLTIELGTDEADAPLFQRIDRGGTVRGRLSDRAMRRIIKVRCAGVEGRVSGHSLRVGSAQSLAAAGAGLVEMQQAGRWQSPTMPARYARGELAARGAVARLQFGQ